MLSFASTPNKLLFHLDVLLKSFKHRFWNHFCWSFDHKTQMNKLFLNGKLEGSFKIKLKESNIQGVPEKTGICAVYCNAQA